TRFSLVGLSQLAKRALSKLGLEGDQLDQVHDVLLYAELRGRSQGLQKIIERTVTPSPEAGTIAIVRAEGATMRIDGAQNPGMVVSTYASDQAVALARNHGVGLAGTFNTSSSTGAIGFYAERIAGEGMIGLVMAGSPKVMAMAGGIDPVFGTNPIAIAVPTPGKPVALDMATAATAWFDLITASRRGESIAKGLAFDCDGEPTSDPDAAMAGALTAFGGHKGAGLALMIEMLTGPLTGAGVVGDEDATSNRGMAIIAIKPSALVEQAEFDDAVDRMCARIRSGRSRQGSDGILLPGDSSRARFERCLETGKIDVETAVLDGVRAIVESAG
ncbi:MAG: Ldh family oxidoreductase, partial [Verrucomicrobiota bacterium]